LLDSYTQNAYLERFNGTARREWLELNIFEDIEHAQLLATEWHYDPIQRLVAFRQGSYSS
jgi:hypothetical protein